MPFLKALDAGSLWKRMSHLSRGLGTITMGKLIALIAIFFIFPSAHGGNLSAPVSFDNAKVLPKGVRNLRYNSIYAGANEKFSSAGSIVPVGNAFNVNVSYNKLIDGQDSKLQKGLFQGYLNREGKNLDSSAGETTGVVNVEVDAKVPVFAMGVTRKWTAAIIVPIVTIKTNVGTGFIASESFKKLANKLVRDGKKFKAEEARDKSNKAIDNKIEKYNYRPLRNQVKDVLGDIRLVNKVQLTNKKNHAIALTGSLVFPTGKESDIDEVVDPTAGDGQIDYGMGIVADWYFNSQLSFSGKIAYMVQAPDTTAKRIPEVFDSTLTPDIDPQVKRDLGNMAYASLGASYLTDLGISLKSQYSFQYKEEDTYRGSKYSFERYGWMGLDTRQSIHTFQVSIGYSTLSLFKRKIFPLPLEINFALARPLAGKNVTKDTTVVAEAAIYF